METESIDEASEPSTPTPDSNSQTSESTETSDNTSSSMEVGASCGGKKQQPKPMKLRKCTIDECKETVLRGKSGPWMCKYHRNKTYKETYKKKKVRNNPVGIPQKKGNDGPSPTLGASDQGQDSPQISMLGQVLNEKKLALMKSPMVQAFLQEQQQTLCNTRKQTLQDMQPTLYTIIQ